MRSISSNVIVSAVRSYSFVVFGDACPAIRWACSSVPPFDRYAVISPPSRKQPVPTHRIPAGRGGCAGSDCRARCGPSRTAGRRGDPSARTDLLPSGPPGHHDPLPARDGSRKVLLVYPTTLDEYRQALETLGRQGSGADGAGTEAGRAGDGPGPGRYVVTTEEQRLLWGLPDVTADARLVDEAQAFEVLCDTAEWGHRKVCS